MDSSTDPTNRTSCTDQEPYREQVTRYYAALARSRDPACDPIAAQFMPQALERHCTPEETEDPLHDQAHQPTERLIHRYLDRVLLLVTDRCATYCRHCFRRHFTARGTGELSPAQLQATLAYLARHPEVREVLLSGGDPLTLEDSAIEELIAKLYAVNSDYVVRVCTRIPVVMPNRITEPLAHILGGYSGLWLVTQVNHPRELTAEFRAATALLQRCGVPVLNQSVLLRGVNDELETLIELFRGLARARIKPYYLFQTDLAAGTSHFRVPIERGLALMRELRRCISGLSLPVYALDLPGAASKLNLETAVQAVEAGYYVLRDPDGRLYRYPREC